MHLRNHQEPKPEDKTCSGYNGFRMDGTGNRRSGRQAYSRYCLLSIALGLRYNTKHPSRMPFGFLFASISIGMIEFPSLAFLKSDFDFVYEFVKPECCCSCFCGHSLAAV